MTGECEGTVMRMGGPVTFGGRVYGWAGDQPLFGRIKCNLYLGINLDRRDERWSDNSGKSN